MVKKEDNLLTFVYLKLSRVAKKKWERISILIGGNVNEWDERYPEDLLTANVAVEQCFDEQVMHCLCFMLFL